MRAHTGRGRLSIKDGAIGQSATPCYGGGGLGGSRRKDYSSHKGEMWLVTRHPCNLKLNWFHDTNMS